MPRKYHLYISSTPDDLKIERAALIRTVFELGHIPMYPEVFDITDAAGERFIRKNIEEADYFVSLVAHRYGDTEAEYNLALKAEVPVIALIIGDKARWKGAKKEQEPDRIQALAVFKEKLKAHPHVSWNNAADLRQNAREILTQELFLNPRRGWAPEDQLAGPSAANALSRLMYENEELKRQIAVQGTGLARWQEKMRHTLEMLAATKISLSFFYNPGENWESTITCRYLRLFKLLVPELYLGKTTAELSRFLGSILNPDLNRTVRKDYPTPSNTIKKIMADFDLLKLVHYAGGADDEVWELTEYGRDLYALYRLHQFERELEGATLPDALLSALPEESGDGAPGESGPL